MKIVLIGSKQFDSLEYNISDSFRALGHQPVTFDYSDVVPISNRYHYWVARFSEPYDKWVHQRLADRVLAERPDLVIGVYRHIHPSLVHLLKQRLASVPVVQLNPDHPAALEKQQIIAANYDFYFTKEPYMAAFLSQKAGLNAHYLPEGFNPRIHVRPAIDKMTAETESGIDVLVFGNLYAYRTRMLQLLAKAGIRIAVYGSQGPYCPPEVKALFCHQYIAGLEKSQLLYGAKIVFNNFHYAEITSVNQKFFEINGVGGFQLCDYKETLHQYSKVPVEAFSYRTIQEAIDKITYYLSASKDRHAVAQAQYDHFQQHHTFDKRMQQLLDIIAC